MLAESNESKTRPHERQREVLRSMASILGEDLTALGWMTLKSWDAYVLTIQTDKQVFKIKALSHKNVSNHAIVVTSQHPGCVFEYLKQALRQNLTVYLSKMKVGRKAFHSKMVGVYITLPETKSSPLKNSNGWKMFQHFRGVCRSH